MKQSDASPSRSDILLFNHNEGTASSSPALYINDIVQNILQAVVRMSGVR
jgi:hypothetical protein